MSWRPQSLDDHIASLPQELKDEILEFFCLAQAESIKIVRVRKFSYRPPYFLQLDRRTRALAAPTYYNRTAFLFMENSNTIPTLQFWLGSLSPAHRASLQALNFIRSRLEENGEYIGYRLERVRRALHGMGFLKEESLLTIGYLSSRGKLMLEVSLQNLKR